MNDFKFGASSRERMQGVDPRLIDIATEALSISPIDFGIPDFGGVRTAEQQNGLFKKGVSKCDGYKNRSNHQDGIALDVYALVNGKASWDPEHLAMIAGVILSVANRKGVAIRWGGTFGSAEYKGWDRPHFELV